MHTWCAHLRCRRNHLQSCNMALKHPTVASDLYARCSLTGNKEARVHTCCAACAAVCSGADECMLCKLLSRSLLATLLLSIQKVLLLPLLACLQTYPFMSAC